MTNWDEELKNFQDEWLRGRDYESLPASTRETYLRQLGSFVNQRLSDEPKNVSTSISAGDGVTPSPSPAFDDLEKRVSNFIKGMSPHHKDRRTGKLLIECRDALRAKSTGLTELTAKLNQAKEKLSVAEETLELAKENTETFRQDAADQRGLVKTIKGDVAMLGQIAMEIQDICTPTMSTLDGVKILVNAHKEDQSRIELLEKCNENLDTALDDARTRYKAMVGANLLISQNLVKEFE